MPITRPPYLRNLTEPVRPPGLDASMRAQTLKTLSMLKNMSYKDVWCKGSEVDAQTIEDAALEGWRVGDFADGRIKFTLAPMTPRPQSPVAPDVVLGEPGGSRLRHVRTMSPVRAPRQLAPIEEGLRRVSDVPIKEQALSVPRPTGPVAWSRRPSAERPALSRRDSPAIVVSPPVEERRSFPFDVQADGAGSDDDWVPPRGSWMAQRQSAASSAASRYSQDSDNGSFHFDNVDPFAVQRRPSLVSQASSGSLKRSNAVRRDNFRPPTPELRINRATRQSNAGLQQPGARPTHQLQRLFSAPAAGSGQVFNLQPVPDAGWGE